MDFRSIKNRRTKTIRRVLGRPGAGTIGVFTGLIGSKFNEWIGRRWGVSKTRLFRAVPLSFREPTHAFGQISWPQSSKTKSDFLFAPNIQLTLNPFQVSNAFLENYTSNLQPSPESKAAQVFSINNYLKFSGPRNTFNNQSSARSTVARDARPFWPTAVQVKDRRQEFEAQPATTALRTSKKFFRQFDGILQPHLITRHSESTDRAPLINLSNFLQHWTQTLRSNLVHRSSEQRHTEERNGKRNAPRNVNATRFFDGRNFVNRLVRGQNTVHVRIAGNFVESILSLDRWLKTKPIDEATSSRQAFTTQVTNSRVRPRQMLQAQSFKSVVQRFAVPKSSSAETLTTQIQYFGPQPDLSYARRESPQLQQLVAALRDVRPAQNESKAPAPQLPSIAQLTSQVRQELEREIRIERERRGL